VSITREQELWAIALWVEKTHGVNGGFYIAQQQDRLLADGDLAGVKAWRRIGARFDQLMITDEGAGPG